MTAPNINPSHACKHCGKNFAMTPYKLKKHYYVCDDCIQTIRNIRKVANVSGIVAGKPITQTIPSQKPTAIETNVPFVDSALDAMEAEEAELASHVSRKTVKEPKIETGTVKYVPQNGEVEELERAISVGLNTLLTGGTGCGKTHLVEHVAEKLGRKLYTIQGGGGATFERIVAQNALEESNGVTVTVRPSVNKPSTWSLLPKAMEEGALLYCDEPNVVPDETLFYLFSAMDDRRNITFDDGTILKAKEGFCVVGAMNEGAGYGGTHLLNNAFRSRCENIIDLDYLPQAREAKMLVERTGIDKDIADKLTKAAKALRASLASKLVKTPIGTRALIACAKLIVAGAEPQSAIVNTIINQAPSTSTERKSIADVIAAHFGKAGK